MIEFRHLRYFLAVAEELHFGRAAERLHIAQPPLSQQIRRLEEMVGVKLFDRTRRSVRLTPAGEVFAHQVSPLFEGLERSIQLAREVDSGQTGSLTIGFVSSAPYTILPAILHKYRDTFPRVSLELQQMPITAQIEALHARRIDIGFLRPPVDDPLLETQRLLSEPFVLAMADSHALSRKKRIEPAMLKNESFIMVPNHRAIFGKIVQDFCEEHGFRPRVVQEATEMHTVVGLVSGGLGIAMVPASIQNIHLPGVAFRPIRGAPHAHIDLAWRKDTSSQTLGGFVALAMSIVKSPVSHEA